MKKGKTHLQKEITEELPGKLKLLLCYRRTPTLIALFILIFGGIICAVQLQDFDFIEYSKLKNNTAQTTGIVTNSYYTGISGTIGDDEGTYYINAYVYEYQVNGEFHKWVSYSRNSYLKNGSKTYIIYNKKAPQYSVIKGYNYRPNGTSVLFLLVFPFIAFLMLLYHVFRGIYFFNIIKNGIITKGKLSRKKIIHEGDSGTYYKLTFDYFSDSEKKNRHEVSVTTTNTKRFQDESIIFHKNKPNMSILVDDLADSVSKHIKKNWI